MTGRTGIIAKVDRPWTDRWRSEANVLSRLALRYPTVWVDPPRHWRGIFGRKPTPTGFRRPAGAEQLEVYTPPALLPFTHRPAMARRLLARARLTTVYRHLRAQGAERIVLYVWRPWFAEVVDLVPSDAVIYHISDEYTFSPNDPPTPPRELRLLRRADQVIVHSPALLEKKGGVNPHTALIPNGVDYSLFAEPCDEPSDLAGVPRPRIGYCGYLKRQLDWRLLQELVRRHDGWSWVFVGAASPHAEIRPILNDLSGRSNVHMLGAKTTREYAVYPQHFDACIMPYRVDDYTQYIFPLKLHEYLASGTPTVGTPIRTLREYGHVIDLAESAEEWSAALSRALAPAARAPEAVRRRQAVAREHDWDALVDRVETVLEATLERTGAGGGRRSDAR